MARARDKTAAVVVALGITQTLAWGSTYYLPAILARPMAAEFGLPPSGVYAMFSAALLVSAAVGPFAGRRIDRRGGRGTLIASSVVFTLGLALAGCAPNAVVLGAAWLVLGVGMAMGLYEAAFSALAAAYGAAARAPITGITLIAGFASTVAWPMTGLLEAGVGWRGACLAWAAVHLAVCLPLNFWMVPDGHRSGSHAAPALAPETGPAPAAPRRTMLLLGFVFTVTWFTSTAMAAHLPALLELAGASAVAAIAAATLVGPAQVAARLFEFGLLRKLHPLHSARFAALAHPIAACTLLAAGAPAAPAFTILHGAGNGVLTIAKGTLPLAVFGPQGYGLRQGLLSGPARIGQAFAPLAFGLAMDRFGVDALLMTAALGLAAYGALLGLGKPR